MSRLLSIAAALLAAAPVSAGVRVETVSRDIQTGKADGWDADVMLIQDGMVRDHATSFGITVIIRDGIFFVLNDAGKTYYVMDEAALKAAADEAAADLKEAQERVKNMPPEERAMLEERMARLTPSVFGKKNTYEWKDTGKNEIVDGRECRIWNLFKNGVIYHEQCVVQYSSLPGKEDFAKAFRDSWDVLDAMTNGGAKDPGYIDARKSMDGYPVRIRSFNDAGQMLASEHVLTKWVEEAIPP